MKRNNDASLEERTRRKVRSEVKRIEEFLRVWDPILVIPALIETGHESAEYDSYAPAIHSLLWHGCTLDDLAAHLEHLRTETMGLPPDKEKDYRAAVSMLAWWKERSF